MKIDKDFVVKVEGKIFKASEITKIDINGGKISLTCFYCDGVEINVTARTKDVEFLTVPCVPEIITRNVFGEVTREKIFRKEMPPHLFHVEGDSIWDAEIVSPLQTMKKAFKEAINQTGNEPESDLDADKSIVSDVAAVKAMKDAANAIDKAAEAMCKATEQIKVDLSIDGEKFSKLINEYGKPITRSGG